MYRFRVGGLDDDDAAALAQRLEWILDHPAEAKAAAQARRRTIIEDFSLESTVNKTDALYRELLKLSEKP